MRTLLFAVISTLSMNAFANYANITCSSPTSTRTVTLQLDETSDIQTDTLGLSMNDKSAKVSQVKVDETQYGILGINIAVGKGPGQYKFLFKNLGSEKCFGVYGSKQNGVATVEVVNSMGVIAKLPCTCEAD